MKSAAVVIANEVGSLRKAWKSLQRDAATFGVKLVKFAIGYSNTYTKVRRGTDEAVVDAAIKSLNASIGIDDSKASMFRGIAERSKMFQQHRAQLPASIDAMYQVAQLSERRAIQLFDKGTIHPGLTVREARELRPSSAMNKRGGGKKHKNGSAARLSINLQWAQPDHSRVLDALHQLLKQCETAVLRVPQSQVRDDLAERLGPALSVRLEK